MANPCEFRVTNDIESQRGAGGNVPPERRPRGPDSIVAVSRPLVDEGAALLQRAQACRWTWRGCGRSTGVRASGLGSSLFQSVCASRTR